MFSLSSSGRGTVYRRFFTAVMIFPLMSLCVGGTPNTGKKADETVSCSAVRGIWPSRGFGLHSIPSTPISGDHLSICSQNKTCCTKPMEEKLHLVGKQEFLKMSSNAFASVHNDFVTKSTKFRDFCIELIKNSTTDLHDMFQKTYGVLYLQNAQIFTNLFSNLQNFFRGRDLDLHEVLEQFFTVLFQRMFALLNTSYSFDKKYLDCVAEYMDDLQPFGDVPQKLSVHIRRAFVAAVTFMQGLRIGQNTLHRISRMDSTDPCSQGVTRMLYCSYCKGVNSIKPCFSYCTTVLTDCFHYSKELNEVWRGYVEAMLKVADRLEGPFNIESVIEPLDVKISDAIMNFQENSEAVTSKVFQECGQPTLGSRRKREISSHSPVAARPSPQSPPTAFDQMMTEIREALTGSKDVWLQLTLSTCTVVSAPLGHENNCWDGKNKARFGLRVVEEGRDNVTNKGHEDGVGLQESNPVIEQQILQLKLITSKLQNAYAGQEVNWMDIDNDNEDDDDDDRDEDDFSGDDIRPSAPSLLPHHRRHHDVKNNNINPFTISTIHSRDVYQTKQVANVERSRVQAKKLSRNDSFHNRALAALEILTLAFSLCISHLSVVQQFK